MDKMDEKEVKRIRERWKGCLAWEDVQMLLSKLDDANMEIEELKRDIHYLGESIR